ncbi:protein of unknown function (DU1801) [Geodermatophilus africanus]|uniref:Uncharacterized protein n=1 Tax=Geodermatophilus africanus TaxID=1137993 RepID=A0A1H3CFS9_9ACTN|nr:protein of unknown function (DU1801) [Geodermatophilus africanus]
MLGPGWSTVAVSTGDLDVLLTRLAPGVADLVRAADALVRQVDPDVVRVVWPHQGTVGYGVGPAKNSEHYAYLATFARHLNLGFNHGASLDHGGLLDGAGTAFRKLTVRRAEDLDDPRLVPLLRAARAERLAALGRA